MRYKVIILIVLLLAAVFAGCSEKIQHANPATTLKTIVPTETQTTAAPTVTTTPKMGKTHTTTTVPAWTTTTTPLTLQFGVKYKVKVLNVIDGDTIDVLLPDGSVERVRMLGVDTPETTAEKNKPYEYDGITDLECLEYWGQQAKKFAENKLEGKTAYIELDPIAGMRGYYGRLLAYVYLQDGTDFTAELVKLGYARVYEEGKCLKESEYLQYQEQAMENRIGLWSCMPVTTTTTITTTTTTVTVTTTITLTSARVVIYYAHYDAAGNDNYNLNDEYIVLKNIGGSPVNLKGWKLKDEANHVYVFPDFVLNPGAMVTVHTGCGSNTDTDLYWCSSRAVWNNDGDTVFLYDAGGNLVDTYSW